MSVDWVRSVCMALPHSTETVQWGNNLVFKIAGKMYAVTCLEPGEVALSCKCTPEEFAELIEQPGIIPAPYLARAHWIALERFDALPRRELDRLLRQAFSLVAAKLPKKTRVELGLV